MISTLLDCNMHTLILSRDHLNRCGENEGDCNNDMDCEGSLVCGHNNCLKTRAAGYSINYNKKQIIQENTV